MDFEGPSITELELITFFGREQLDVCSSFCRFESGISGDKRPYGYFFRQDAEIPFQNTLLFPFLPRSDPAVR